LIFRVRRAGVRQTRVGRPRSLQALTFLLGPAILSLLAAPAGADRNVLAPRGLVTNPDSVKLEYAVQDRNQRNQIGWLNIGMPQQLLGLELEVEHFELGGRRRETVSAQYSLTGNAFTLEAPAVSVGVRDLLNRGRERQAVFVALTKTIGLSLGQERFLRDLKIHGGLGSRRLEGPFLGFQARLAAGPTISAEYVARRINASIGVSALKFLQLKVYTLDRELFWGASITLAK
jgi:hypothetical protein